VFTQREMQSIFFFSMISFSEKFTDTNLKPLIMTMGCNSWTTVVNLKTEEDLTGQVS
jgi:hypothetical protein